MTAKAKKERERKKCKEKAAHTLLTFLLITTNY
jgi:hypothetical protein